MNKLTLLGATCSNQVLSLYEKLISFVFKEIIDNYIRRDNNIYCCFLDASRAYDRVSHTKLFSALKTRGVPIIYIRIIAFWYKHQFLYVKWGNSISEGFKVTNGVRQGRYDPMSCYSFTSLASLQSQISHIICLLFIKALTSETANRVTGQGTFSEIKEEFFKLKKQTQI